MTTLLLISAAVAIVLAALYVWNEQLKRRMWMLEAKAARDERLLMRESSEVHEELIALLNTALEGHAADCGYCSCGHSKTQQALRRGSEARKEKELEQRKKFEQKLLSEGWQPPMFKGH